MSKIRFDADDDEESRSLSAAEIINNDSFERLKSKSARKKFGEAAFILLAVLILCGILFLICGYMFFKVKTIHVDGNVLYSAEDIITATGITDRDNLFSIKETVLTDSLTLQFPYIKSVTVTRNLPTSLVIHVVEDTPCYYSEIQGEYYLLSESLRVLERAKDPVVFTDRISGLLPLSLPTVTYMVVGREVAFVRESTYDYMIAFLSALRASPLFSELDSIDSSDKFSMYIVFSGHRYKAILGSNDDMQAKLSFLAAIISSQFNESTIAEININKVENAFITYKTTVFTD